MFELLWTFAWMPIEDKIRFIKHVRQYGEAVTILGPDGWYRCVPKEEWPPQ